MPHRTTSTRNDYEQKINYDRPNLRNTSVNLAPFRSLSLCIRNITHFFHLSLSYLAIILLTFSELCNEEVIFSARSSLDFKAWDELAADESF